MKMSGFDENSDHTDKGRLTDEAALWLAKKFIKIEEINGDGIPAISDSCHLEITLRKVDLPRFAPFIIAEPGEKWISDTGTPRLVTISTQDADFAWHKQREAAARAGIPFYGHHGAGQYDACAFASLDGEMIDVSSSDGGTPSVGVDENLQPVGDMKDLRAYFAKLKAVKKLFRKKEKAVCEDDPSELFD